MKSNVIYGNDMTIWGEFQGDCAGFNMKSLNLPAPWDYIYQNRGILLKVDQFTAYFKPYFTPFYASTNSVSGLRNTNERIKLYFGD